MKHWFVIANPAAGGGKVGERLPELCTALEEADLSFTLHITSYAGEATTVAQEALQEGRDALLIVGGDGTINEAVTGLLHLSERPPVTFGIVPLGTGSDLIKSLPDIRADDIPGAIRRMRSEHTHTIDVGCVTFPDDPEIQPHYFLNTLGMGMDAQGTIASTRIKRFVRGALVYHLAALGVMTYRAVPMRVSLDGAAPIERPLQFVSIGNGKCQGGNFWMTPDALLDDGELDVCIADAMTIPRLLSYMPKVQKAKHKGLPGIDMRRFKTLSLRAERPIPIAADGEVTTTGTRAADVRILPGAISLLI